MSDSLKSEVLSIVDQLSHDELRVFRFMGRRMLDIGHVKYGALDLSTHDRRWTKEQAQETSDRLFYEQCHELAKEDARAARLHCFKHDLAYAKVDTELDHLCAAANYSAQSPRASDTSASPTIDYSSSPCERVSSGIADFAAEDSACTDCLGIGGKHAAGCPWIVQVMP